MTTTRLILMRHAKSSWYSGEQEDFLRPLNDRGRRDAVHMGEWLARAGLPARIVSSPARRTRQTLELLAQGAKADLAARTEWLDALYHASVPAMLDVLSAQAAYHDVMLLGHNPGLEELLDLLVGDVPNDGHGKLFPTGAIYILSADVPLDALYAGCAVIESHQRPRALAP